VKYCQALFKCIASHNYISSCGLVHTCAHNKDGILYMPVSVCILQVNKGNQELSFYSLPEMEQWKAATPNHQHWKVKYYKGLGTSTSKEAKEYFSDMAKHRIPFKYSGPEDDHAIELV